MTTFYGTGGIDSITGTGTADTIFGYGGNDFLLGGDGADYIDGGDGNDIVFDLDTQHADTATDTLYGGNGDDLIGGGFLDNIDGGAGFDSLILTLSNMTSGATFDFTGIWSGATYSFGGATIQHMERLSTCLGTSYNDILTTGSPTGQTPWLMGGDGGDRLTGGAGLDNLAANVQFDPNTPVYDTAYDILYGLGGDDRISCGIGDYADGGTGNDQLRMDLISSGSAVSVNFGTLLTTGSATILGTTLISFEGVEMVLATNGNDTIVVPQTNQYSSNLYGRDGNDVLTTGNGADILDGGLGADTMSGGDGYDQYYVDNAGDVIIETSQPVGDQVYSSISYTLPTNVEYLTLTGTAALDGMGNALANVITGNTSNNVLTGLDGDDRLDGGAGGDALYGGTGKDTLIGSTGSDVFVFNQGDVAGTTWTNSDRITDFSQGDSDRISLAGMDAVTGGTDDAFAFIGTAAFSHVAGQLRYDNAGGVTTIYGDMDGDGIADFAIGLNNAVALVAADFIL